MQQTTLKNTVTGTRIATQARTFILLAGVLPLVLLVLLVLDLRRQRLI